jgi:hypothetical protein
MISDWVSFLAYPNLFGIKGFVVVVGKLLAREIYLLLALNKEMLDITHLVVQKLAKEAKCSDYV